MISYGDDADDILVTCRRGAEAAPNDQVQVLVRRADCTTGAAVRLGHARLPRHVQLRASTLTATGHDRADAAGAVRRHPGPDDASRCRTSSGARSGAGSPPTRSNRARAFVRAEARKNAGRDPPISAIRLAEVDSVLQEMRHNVAALAHEYQALLEAGDPAAFGGFGFAIRINNLKLSCSQLSGRHRQPGDADLRHLRLPQRFQVQPGPPPARRLRGGADGEQRPHHSAQTRRMLLAHKEGTP